MTIIEIVQAIQDAFPLECTFRFVPLNHPSPKYVLCTEYNRKVSVYFFSHVQEVETSLKEDVVMYPFNCITVFSVSETKLVKGKIKTNPEVII